MTQISIQNLIFTRIYFLITLFIIIIGNLSASIINIPADQPTIQAGIDIAAEGDTILVSPGTYYENIEIVQKNDIHIIGSGVDVTVIDGNENGHVVKFNHASGSISELSITNSGDDPLYSSGIFTSFSTVEIISNNVYNNCYGIAISNESTVQINGNRVTNNIGFRTISIMSSVATLTHNLVADNQYSGIYNDVWSTITIINNTLVGNNNHIGITVNAIEQQLVRNNIICGFEFGIFVLGDQLSAVPFVDISYNDVWNNSIADYWEEYGPLSNIYSQPFLPQPGTGEIHEDPFFVDPVNGDYHLQSNSPCIDAGDPYLPFDPDGTISDIGAYYYHQNSENDDNVIKYSANLINNFPNPFNPVTNIYFSTHSNAIISLNIYNIRGQLVSRLINNEFLEKGNYSLTWYGKEESSQIYFVVLKIGNNKHFRKIMLLK